MRKRNYEASFRECCPCQQSSLLNLKVAKCAWTAEHRPGLSGTCQITDAQIVAESNERTKKVFHANCDTNSSSAVVCRFGLI